MTEPKPQTARQEALERVQTSDAEQTAVIIALHTATKAWGELQHQADAAFLEVVRLQGELVLKRHAQKLARLILISTPDSPAVEPMKDGLHA